MDDSERKRYAGLCLCLLAALAAAGVLVKVGLNLKNLEFSSGQALASQPALPAGQSAPGFSLKDLDGGEVSLQEQQGKVVLLDFWATWCGPCVQELPHIQHFHEKYRDQGLKVLAISMDSEKSKVRPFVAGKGYTFQVLFGDGKVDQDYQVSGIPAVYLIDRDGVIQFHQEGYGPGQEKDLEQQVERQLERKPGL